MLNKQRVIDAIVQQLTQELSILTAAALTAREAATHEESKPEDSHDTRGIEASYLAGAQAERAMNLQRMIAVFKFLPVRAASASEGATSGALLELESLGKTAWYFLMSQGGGVSVTVDGKAIQVITPTSPLGEELLDRKAGDVIEIENHGKSRKYRVLSVA